MKDNIIKCLAWLMILIIIVSCDILGRKLTNDWFSVSNGIAVLWAFQVIFTKEKA
jgi:hypothetical protein